MIMDEQGGCKNEWLDICTRVKAKSANTAYDALMTMD
jgi:hypothetical protein